MNEKEKYKRESRVQTMGCLTAIALIIIAIITGVYTKEVNAFGSNHTLLSVFIGVLIVAWIFYLFYKMYQ
jgi:hypothetical protein